MPPLTILELLFSLTEVLTGKYGDIWDEPLSLISDIILLILIIHTIILVPISQKRSRNKLLLRLPLAPILISKLFLAAALFRNVTGQAPSPFAEINFSRKTNEKPIVRAAMIQRILQEGINVNEKLFPMEASMGIVSIPDDGTNTHILSQNLFSTLRSAKQEKEISAIELLLRWKAPDSVNSNPEVFIPIAKAAGLLGVIGKLILELFAQNFSHISRIKPDLLYSINISPAQFFGQNLKPQIMKISPRFSINPTNIQLKLTEPFFMERFADTESMINKLKRLGIRLAQDDFGTGDSSLQYLKYLPVDTLKVDKAFVQGIPRNHQSKILMDVILSAGKAIDAKIVIERIETEKQFIYLKEKKVDMFQGFLFYKPMELDK